MIRGFVFAYISVQAIAQAGKPFHLFYVVRPSTTACVRIKMIPSITKLNRDEVVPFEESLLIGQNASNF